MTAPDTGIKALHPDNRISALRNAIDEIDNRLLVLINNRLKLAAEIGTLKKVAGNPVKDLEREKRILSRLRNANKGPIDNGLLRRVFADIIRASCYLQNSTHLKPESDCHD